MLSKFFSVKTYTPLEYLDIWVFTSIPDEHCNDFWKDYCNELDKLHPYNKHIDECYKMEAKLIRKYKRIEYKNRNNREKYFPKTKSI
jgi:hypothetical protein